MYCFEVIQLMNFQASSGRGEVFGMASAQL